MSTHVLIDGYNLLPVFARSLPFSDAALAETELLSLLAGYRKQKRLKLTVIWDSYRRPPTAEQAQNVGGIKNVYTAEGITADVAILHRASRLGEAAVIVSDDRDLARAARDKGAATIGCSQFLQKVEFARYSEKKGILHPEDDEPYQKKGLTKGNPKKLKKAKRQKNKRLEKL